MVSKAGVSRYKDHGELMNQLVRSMKLDQVAALVDRRLEQLNDLYHQMEARQSERRDRNTKIALALLTAFLGAGAVKGIVNSAFHMFHWQEKQAVAVGLWENRVALVLMVVVGVGSFLLRKRFP